MIENEIKSTTTVNKTDDANWKKIKILGFLFSCVYAIFSMFIFADESFIVIKYIFFFSAVAIPLSVIFAKVSKIPARKIVWIPFLINILALVSFNIFAA